MSQKGEGKDSTEEKWCTTHKPVLVLRRVLRNTVVQNLRKMSMDALFMWVQRTVKFYSYVFQYEDKPVPFSTCIVFSFHTHTHGPEHAREGKEVFFVVTHFRQNLHTREFFFW